MDKIYAVEFLNYTNYLHDTVSDQKDDDYDFSNIKYIHTGLHSFLIREKDIEYYKQFGGGFKNLIFVGNLNYPDDKD